MKSLLIKMRWVALYSAVALALGLASAVTLNGAPPDEPTLLFHNDGTRSLRLYVDGIYVGSAGAGRQVCLSIPFRPGLARLEARSLNGRHSWRSPPLSIGEAEGWYWRIGPVPEQDAKLSLRPAERCQIMK